MRPAGTFIVEEGVEKRRVLERPENGIGEHSSYQRLKSQGHPQPIQTSDSDI